MLQAGRLQINLSRQLRRCPHHDCFSERIVARSAKGVEIPGRFVAPCHCGCDDCALVGASGCESRDERVLERGEHGAGGLGKRGRGELTA